MADTLLFQGLNGFHPAHRRIELANERLADLLRRGFHGHIHIIDDRHFRCMKAGGLESLCQLIRCRLHQRTVGRYANRQGHGPFGAGVFTGGNGTLHCGGGTGDHYLPRGIEVHRFDHIAFGGLLTGRADLIIIQTQHGGHLAFTGGYGLLHQLSAGTHQAHRIAQGDHTGTGQRGVLAQAVASQQIGARTAALLPQPPQSNTCRQQQGLGVFGLVQGFLGTILTESPDIQAEGAGGFLKGLLYRRAVGKVSKHAKALGTLTGKNKSSFGHSLSP